MRLNAGRLSIPDLATFAEIVDLRDARWFLRRYWIHLLAAAAAGAAAGVAWTFLFPATYRSETRIRFMPPQLAGRFVNPNFSMEVDQRLFALSQLLSSRLTATRLIESFQLYPERRRFQAVADIVPKFTEDLAITQISPGDSAQHKAVPTLQIAFRYPNPELAQKVVQKMVEQVYEENRKYRGDQSMGTTEFLAEQLRAAEEKMLEAEAQLGEVQDAANPRTSTNRLGESTSRSYVIDSRIRDLRHDRRLLEERRSMKHAEVAQLETDLRTISARPPQYYFPQVAAMLNFIHLHDRLTATRAAALRMRERWQPGFPDREIAEAEFREAEELLKNYQLEQALLIQNQDRERVISKLTLARIEARGLDTQDASGRKEEVELQNESQRLRELAAAPAGMETDVLIAKREYETSKEHYTGLLKKHEESKAASDMERRGQGESVELLDAPSLPVTPDSLPRPYRIAAAGFGGLFLGFLLSLIHALRDPRILHEGHLEGWAGLEVLAAFPAVAPTKTKSRKPPSSGGGQQSWRRRAVTAAFLLSAFLPATGCGDRFTSAETLWKRGLAAEKDGKSTAALLFYRQAIRKDPKFGNAYRSAGMLSIRQGELLAARDFLTRAIEFNPANSELHSRLADTTYQIYFNDPGRPTTLLREVEALAQTLIARWPRLADGYRIFAQVLLERHRTEEAVDYLLDAVKKVDQPDTLQVQAATALFRLGRGEESESLLAEVIARSPSYTAPYDLLYLQRMQRKDSAAARDILVEKWNRTADLDAALQLAAHDDAFGHRDLAVELFKTLASNPAAGPLALARIGDFWMHRGDRSAALAAYQFGRKQHPGQATAYISRIAEWHLSGKKPADAKSFIAAELAARPRDLILQAYASAVQLGQPSPQSNTEERRKLESILQQLPDSPFVRYHLGRAYLFENSPKAALEQFERCVKLDPNYAPGWVALAELEIVRGNPAAAELRAESVLRSNPNHLPANLVRAKALVTRGKAADAEKSLERVLQIQPDNTDAIFLLASARLSRNLTSQAQELLEKGRALAPDESRWILAESGLLASRGDAKAALALLQTRRKTADTALLERIAALQIQLHDGAGAVLTFQDLLSRHPAAIDYRIGLAGATALTGDRAKASSLYTELEKLDPKNPKIWLQHAALLTEMEHRPAATAKYEQALALDKNNPLILNNLAWLMLQDGGSAEKALEFSLLARRTFGRSAEIDDTLAAAYTRLKMFRNASAVYQEMLTYIAPPERPRVQKLLDASLKHQTPKGDV